MRARPSVIAGAALGGLAVLWQFGLSPRWTQRVPVGWSTLIRYVGTVNPADARGEFHGSGALELYERAQRTLTDRRPHWVILEERYTVRDSKTGRPAFEYTTRDSVDPQSGRHADAAHRGEILLFPRHVQPVTYQFRSNYVNGIPLAFERAESLEGLPAYVFSYRGRLEQTAVYANSTGDLGGLRVSAGQEIRCLDDQFYYRIWVEPTTGEQIRLEEGCPSGDYIYDAATGRPVAPIARWTGVTAGDDLTSRIVEIRRVRWLYLWASRYAAWALVAAAVLLVGIGLRRAPSTA